MPSSVGKAAWVRRAIREVLGLAFWIHAVFITGLLHLPAATSPILSRYIFNALMVVFIVNYSLFSNRGWWSVLFDLIYIYFLPFIYVGRSFWWITRATFRCFKSRIVWQNPRLINVAPKTTLPIQTTPPIGKGADVEASSEDGFRRRIPRLFLKFVLLWSLLILTVNSKPFLYFAVLIATVGVARALFNLWGMFSGGSTWVDKIEENLAKKIAEYTAQMDGWDGSSNPEAIRQALNGLKIYSSAFNFIADNTAILASWAFTFSVIISVPFYCYISLLFSLIYLGIAKIMTLNFSFPEAFVDSLFMPFAWSALPPNLLMRFIGGVQATCVSIIGYNILFRHIGNRLDRITSVAVKLRDPFSTDSFKSKLSQVEGSLSNNLTSSTTTSAQGSD